jgi:hypothetical protein
MGLELLEHALDRRAQPHAEQEHDEENNPTLHVSLQP